MTAYRYIGSTPGAWTDPRNWDTGVVPFWDYGSTVDLGGHSVTLHDIEPNNMTVGGGSAPGTAATRIVLDNAAFGPGLDVQVTSPAPQTSQYDYARLDISVIGCDTNYGTIEATPAPTMAGSYFLDMSVGSGSQLNNEGTIVADGHASPSRSQDTTLAIGSADSYNRGTLNNSGHIDVLDDTIASIEPAVVGTGTITLGRLDGAAPGTSQVNGAFPQLAFLTSVAATQTVELDAGQISLYVPYTQPQQPPRFNATIAGWNTHGQVLLAAPFKGSSVAYTPTSPGHGDLTVSSAMTASGQAAAQSINLHLAGNYTTSDFVLTNNYLGTIVSIRG